MMIVAIIIVTIIIVTVMTDGYAYNYLCMVEVSVYLKYISWTSLQILLKLGITKGSSTTDYKLKMTAKVNYSKIHTQMLVLIFV